MGLFINNRKHPDVYKTQEEIKEPNQSYTRQDFMTEIMKEQQEANASLRKAYEELKIYYRQHETTQTNQMNQLGSQISELKVNYHQQEEIESKMLQWLKMLDEKNINLQTSMDKQRLEIMNINDSNKEIAERLELQDAKINEQLELQRNAVEFQTDVLKRLDSQEALTEKIYRQLNHIRSVLFERTNYLAAKVEEGYKVTSSYIYKLMTGSEQPLTFFLLNQKKEENQQPKD